MFWKVPTGGSIYPKSRFNWAPTLTSHDPNPPLPLETAAVAGGTGVPIVGIDRIEMGFRVIKAGSRLGGVIQE